MRPLLALVAAAALASPLSAQVQFVVECSGDNEVPPVASDGVGLGFLTLNGSNELEYDIRHDRLDATAAHIHLGAAGVNGGVVFGLTKVAPGHRQGTSAALTPTQLDDLRNGDWYVNIHTPANSGGELRGQVVPYGKTASAILDSDQVVGGGNPAASATGSVNAVRVGSSLFLTHGVNHTVSAPLKLELRQGAPGVDGPVLESSSSETSPGSYASTWVANLDDWEAYQNGELYLQITSAAFPGGEVRGQLLPSDFTALRDSPAVDLELRGLGSPIDLASNDLKITDCAPNSMVFLIGSLGRGLFRAAGEPVLIDVTTLDFGVQVFVANGSGSVDVDVALPELFTDADVYYQAYNVDAGAPNGMFTVSNLMEVRLRDVR